LKLPFAAATGMRSTARPLASLVLPVVVNDTAIGPYAGTPSAVFSRKLRSVSRRAVGHSCGPAAEVDVLRVRQACGGTVTLTIALMCVAP
jgi:hypothetical protein